MGIIENMRRNKALAGEIAATSLFSGAVFFGKFSQEMHENKPVSEAIANSCSTTIVALAPLLILPRLKFINRSLNELTSGTWDKYVDKLHAFIGVEMSALALAHGSAQIYRKSFAHDDVSITNSTGHRRILGAGHGDTATADEGHSESDYIAKIITGSLMSALFFASSISGFKRHSMTPYKNFIYLHRGSALLLMGAYVTHNPHVDALSYGLVGGTVVVFGLDRLYDRVKKTYSTQLLGDSKEVSPELVQLLLNKPGKFNHKAGQFAELCIPNLGRYWHPASIASCDSGGDLRFIISKQGRWTNNLHTNIATLVANSAMVKIRGPFHSQLQKAVNEEFLTFLSTGVGINPFLSILKASKARETSAHIVSRDKAVFDYFIDFLTKLAPSATSKFHIYYTGRAEQASKLDTIRGIIQKHDAHVELSIMQQQRTLEHKAEADDGGMSAAEKSVELTALRSKVIAIGEKDSDEYHTEVADVEKTRSGKRKHKKRHGKAKVHPDLETKSKNDSSLLASSGAPKHLLFLYSSRPNLRKVTGNAIKGNRFYYAGSKGPAKSLQEHCDQQNIEFVRERPLLGRP